MRIAVLSMLLCLGGVAPAHAECVIELQRSEVNVVNGELRIDLRNEIRRRCQDFDLSRARIDEVKIVLDDDRRRRFGRERFEERFRRDDRRGRRGGDRVEIFRFFNGRQHLVSDDPDAGEKLGYRQNEGFRFSLFGNPGPNRVALYSCVVPGQNDRFLSRQADCEGQRSEGLIGYVRDSEGAGAGRPLYRCYYAKNQNHLITVDKNECIANRFALEPILGYVP